jgi:hypothetical protein
MKVAERTIGNMQAKDGHLFYRDFGWKKVTIPMLHWGQVSRMTARALTMGKLTLSQA